ncbi:MAG: TonB-dependent receptor [Phenylobacterium sp.]
MAKKPQQVDEAAAAVFVIDQEDIRRSGSSTIPDLLRMVPGLEVATLTSGGSAVSARGFNGFSSNKLLILVDGRPIYLSVFSGVFWDQQLAPLEDIQRIEVVRGPGATLWGANAVNGVINVVTKHAVDTLGASGSLQADTADGGRFDARYGAQLGASGAIRLYLTGRQQDGLVQSGAAQFTNHSEGLQGGFRADVEPSGIDALTIQGDMQSGSYHFPQDRAVAPGLPLPTGGDFSGANVLGRWTRTWDPKTGMSLQLYWDHVKRSQSGIKGATDKLDLDFSHHFSAGRQSVVWGAGLRQTTDDVTGQSFLFLDPAHRQDLWYGAYVEDDITLAPDRLNVSIGAKIEHNDFSGFEFQPSIRTMWRSPYGWSMWGAISRAVRTPSDFETGLTVLTPFVVVLPSTLKSERLTAYEIGWRGHLWSGAALDVTAYHQEYDRLIAQGVDGSAGPFGPLIGHYGNRIKGSNDGIEAALDVRVTPQWTLKAAGSWQSLSIPDLPLMPGSSMTTVREGASPKGQVSVRSRWNVTDTVDFDAWVRHVGELDGGAVKAYTNLDLRLAWRPTAHLEVSLSGFNLLSSQRIEFIEPNLPFRAVVQRRGQVGLSVRY